MINNKYAIVVVMKLKNNISRVNLESSYLLSLILAASRAAYVPIPKSAINKKYSIIEFAKFTEPIPSGSKILLAYGKEIIGKIIFITLFIELKSAFFLSDFCLMSDILKLYYNDL